MKRLIGVLLGLSITLTCVSSLWAAEISATSHIVKVTVYPNAALVTRKINVDLPVGIHTITIPGIVTYFDENTLRITGKGTEEVKIYGAQAQKEFITDIPSERLREIQDRIQTITDQMRVVQNRKEVLDQKKAFLDSLRLYTNGQLPKDLVTKMPQTAELEALLKFYDERLSDNYAQQVESDTKLRDLQKTLAALQSEEAQLGSGRGERVITNIVVEVESAKKCAAELYVSYLIPGAANWQPLYDARADVDANKTEVVCYGLVTQNTGEDWDNVEMSLTTSKPTIGGRMPEPHAFLLQPFHAPRSVAFYDNKKQDYAARKSLGALAENTLACAEVAGDMLRVEQESTIAYATAEQKGISVVYKAPRNVTVKANNTAQKIPMFAIDLATDFVYFSNPTANQQAYLGAEVTNTSAFPLLTGKVNIFLGGDLVSSSILENVRPQEKFNFYFGTDEDVKVSREELEKKTDTVLIGTIQSSTIKVTYKYKLTVENYKAKKVTVNLFESLPVSQDERIKVRIGEVNPAPASKDYKDRKGVWLWHFELAPSAKQEIVYTYTIEYPRNLGIENILP